MPCHVAYTPRYSAIYMSSPSHLLHCALPLQAPEAVVGDTRCKSDVFGVGATVFFMATGKHPFGLYRGETLPAYFYHIGTAFNTGLKHSAVLTSDIANCLVPTCDPLLVDMVTSWMQLQLAERPASSSSRFLNHPFLAR